MTPLKAYMVGRATQVTTICLVWARLNRDGASRSQAEFASRQLLASAIAEYLIGDLEDK